jgi:hypothetical protein
VTYAVYVESDTAMASDHSTVAWLFDIEFWGVCGQGDDETGALDALRAEVGGAPRLVVVERIVGDELAFERDFRPATETQRDATAAILTASREALIRLLVSCTPEMLDYDDPGRTLPSFASWRTLRQMAWHIADTESRYYLPSLGLPSRPRAEHLDIELIESRTHVAYAVDTMAPDMVSRDGRWTTTKVLRRLAWHERSELRAMRDMARTAAATIAQA